MSKIVIWRSLLLLLAAAGWLVPGPVNADRGGRQAQGKDAEDAAEKAQQSTGGRVLNVQDQNHPDKGGYKVRVLTPDGRVRTVDVESRKGK
jgi:uncharacterized membrane protein YkoI